MRPSKSLLPYKISFLILTESSDHILLADLLDSKIFLTLGYNFALDFSDQKFIEPWLKVKFLSGTNKSSSKQSISPRPSHFLHAPYGLLKLNILGSISSMLNPLTGHINLLDNLWISFFSISSISIFPSLSFRHISTLLAVLSKFSLDGIIRSTTTEIVCLKFLLSSGISFFS